MPASGQRISRAEAKQALLRSGYLIESRIEKILAEDGYYVEANDAYLDPHTGKSREIDLYALVAQDITRGMDFVFNAILIECVNNPQPLVLLTKEPQVGFLFHEDLRVAGLPVKLAFGQPDGSWVSIHEALRLEKFHHYCASRVATQFCSFTRKSNQEWFALHEGPHFDSFQKLCDAVDYAEDKHFKSWRFTDDEPINIEIYYPVLVVQGELLEARPLTRSVRLRQANHLQFRRTVIRGASPSAYQIDIVTEEYFPRFLEILDEELGTIVRRIKTRMRRFRDSIHKIASKGRRLRSPDAIRRLLENPS